MKTDRIQLDISADQFLDWYRGVAKNVLARTEDGRVIQFPANVLQGFVGLNGIQGTFLLTYDSDYRFISIARDPKATTTVSFLA